jgi:hypothetical protein
MYKKLYMKTLFHQNSSKCSKGKIFSTLTLVVALMMAGCDKDNDGGASKLIGEWTSVSATGTVAFGTSALGVDVAKTINENMAAHDLTDIVNLEFDKEGAMASSGYPGVLLLSIWKYTLKGNILRFSDFMGHEEEVLEIAFNGKDEFTTKSISIFRSEIATTVAFALCDREVKKRGYESVTAAGLQLSSANNLTIKFQKKKK